MRKLLLSILFAIVALLLLAVAFVLAANWRDAPLSDDARAVLDAEPARELPGIANGFPLIAGFNAPLVGDPVQAARDLGKQRLQREIERKQWFETEGLWSEADKAPKPLEPTGVIKATQVLPDHLSCKKESESNCHIWYVEYADQLRTLIAEQQAILKRLESIPESGQVVSEFPIYYWHTLPPYQVLMRAQELQLAQASLLWHSGQQELALREVLRTDRTIRAISDSATELVGSMISVAMAYRKQRWFADLLTSGQVPASPKVREIAQSLLEQPVPTVYQGLHSEAVFQVRALKLIYEDERNWQNKKASALPSWQTVLHTTWMRTAFLPNESLNLQTAWWQLYLPTVQVPAHKYDKALEDFQQREKTLLEQHTQWLGVRNFTGRVLTGIAKPNFSTYIQRRFDVDAHRRMVMLMLQAKEQQISDEKMPAWLAQSPENLRNPYTLEPMQWEAATRSLVFEGRESQNQNPGNSKTYRVKF